MMANSKATTSFHRSTMKRWAHLFVVLIKVITSESSGDTSRITDNRSRRIETTKCDFKSPFSKVPENSFGTTLRANNTDTPFRGCDMCAGLHGRGILPDAPLPSFPICEYEGNPPNEGTCADWNNHLLENIQFDTYECIYAAYFLAPQCCDRSNMTASYVCESQLSSDLFGDDSSYTTAVIPVPAGKDHLDVNVTLTYWHVTNINTVDGTAEIFFSIDLIWNDERLAWDPAEYDGCLDTTVRASMDPETTDIYVPDFDLFNRIESIQLLPLELARVTADGTVFWKRNGGLKAICAFEGLEPMPFDTLSCFLEFGSSTGRKVMYHFHQGDPGTPGLYYGHFPSQFQEFSLLPEKSTTTSVVIDLIQSLRYDFFFERAKPYYITKIVIPTMLFTYLSFGSFLLDQRVGERLSFGVSILLVLVAQSIVTADMLPISDNLLWIDAFALFSYYWVIITVFESVIVAYLYYLDSEEEKKEVLRKEREEEEEKLRESRMDAFASNRIHESNREERANHEGALDAREVSQRILENSPWSDAPSNAEDNQPESTGVEVPTERQKVRMIKKLDFYSLILLPLTYTIFVIVMFATGPYWARSV